MDVIRIVLADDHTLFREGTRELLDRESDLEVVGEAGDGEAAVALVDELLPDVVVLDLEMPRMNGIEATKVIKERHPEVGVLALTVHDEEPYVFAILEAGAAGYLLKDVHASQVVEAVRELRNGESILHPSIARQVLNRVRSGGEPAQHDLSEQEVEVLRLAASGLRNIEIAEQLGVSQRTVQLRLSRVFTKFNVGSRTEAVIRGLKEGLFRLEDLT